jgi:hypothetical protein
MVQKNQELLIGLAALVVVVVLIYLYSNDTQKSVEGFDLGDDIQSLEDKLLSNYKSEDSSKTKEQLQDHLARAKLVLDKYGLHPGANSPDLSKCNIDPDSNKCTVAKAEDRDKYIHKSDMPESGPNVDLSKYVLKSSIPPEKVCPPPKEVDLSKYVLKSTIPPQQECPACVCPKVQVSAGLCQKCPPPPKCPAPKACEEKICLAPAPCPSQGKCPPPVPCPTQEDKVRYDIKYIKVPTVVTKTVEVDKYGNMISQHIGDENKNRKTSNQKLARLIQSYQDAKSKQYTSASETISSTLEQGGTSRQSPYNSNTEASKSVSYKEVIPEVESEDKVNISYNVSQQTPTCLNPELNRDFKKRAEGVYGYPF